MKSLATEKPQGYGRSARTITIIAVTAVLIGIAFAVRYDIGVEGARPTTSTRVMSSDSDSLRNNPLVLSGAVTAQEKVALEEPEEHYGPHPAQWPEQPKWLVSEEDAKRYVTDGKPSTGLENRTCSFTDCKGTRKEPFYHFVTPHRNRARSLGRLLQSIKHDIQTDGAIPMGCVCVVVADFDDETWGPTVASVVEENWNNEQLIHVRIKNPFVRVWGLVGGMDAGVLTPHDRSIVHFIDTDMMLLPGYIRNTLLYIKRGKTYYSPIIANQVSGLRNPEAYNWRLGGYGMIAAYASDFDKLGSLGGWPGFNSGVWGGEDLGIFNNLRDMVKIDGVRVCEPRLWHLQHPKQKWSSSPNGLGTKFPADVPQYFDLAPPWWPERADWAARVGSEYIDSECLNPKILDKYGFPSAIFPGQRDFPDRPTFKKYVDCGRSEACYTKMLEEDKQN